MATRVYVCGARARVYGTGICLSVTLSACPRVRVCVFVFLQSYSFPSDARSVYSDECC